MKNKLPLFIFTGGGSGGHFLVCLTIINQLRKDLNLSPSNSLLYIGGKEGAIEEKKIKNTDIPYKAIACGKLKRTLFSNHFKEFSLFLMGFFQTFFYFYKERNRHTIVFSSGGYVSVPVVFSARLTNFLKKRNNTIFIHEQTSRGGLANIISSYFCDIIFLSFKSSTSFFPVKKSIISGYPLRDALYKETKNNFFDSIDLSKINRKIIFFTGGGNGSMLINHLVDEFRKEKNNFFIFHQTGQKFIEEYKPIKDSNYYAFAFSLDIVTLLKKCDLIITRAGAGICSEVMYLRKKAIFIPLKIAQKNEQYYNSKEVVDNLNMGRIVKEDEISKINLKNEIDSILKESHTKQKIAQKKSSEIIVEKIKEFI